MRFIEKPEKSIAEKLIQDDSFSWNSGIFMFKASTIIKELGKSTIAILHRAGRVYVTVDQLNISGDLKDAIKKEGRKDMYEKVDGDTQRKMYTLLSSEISIPKNCTRIKVYKLEDFIQIVDTVKKPKNDKAE